MIQMNHKYQTLGQNYPQHHKKSTSKKSLIKNTLNKK